MSNAKQASKRKRRSKTLPVLGAAGLSLSLVGSATATTGGPATDNQTPRNILPNHEIILGEEEISDVSLGTFYFSTTKSLTRSVPISNLPGVAAAVAAVEAAAAEAEGVAAAEAAVVAAGAG